MKNTTIHIALVSSDEYMKYTAVVMLSVLQHLPTKQSIFFHILTEDITDNSKNKIIKMKNKYNFDVEYIYIDDARFKMIEKVKTPSHVKRITYARLFLPDLLPDLDKVLCLDSDLLINKDISKLYNLNIDNYLFAAAEDANHSKIAERLWGNKNLPYFNTGVLLINLQKLRSINYTENLKQKIQINSSKYQISDQDIINDAFRDYIFPISISWNFYHEYLFSMGIYKPSNINDYKIISSSPAIIHFVGAEKPWFPSVQHPYKQQFLKIYKLTPFYNPWKMLYKYNYTIGNNTYKSLYLKSYCLYSQKDTPNEKSIYKLGLKKEKNKQYDKLSFLGISIKEKAKNFQNTSTNYLGYILKRLKKANYKSISFLGMTIVSKKDTPEKQYIKICGIPIYYHLEKNIRLYETQKNLLQQIEIMQQKIDKLSNLNNFVNKKISNLKCIIEAQKLHEKTFAPYKNAFAGKDVVLVCTGQSAKKYKMIPDAIHVGINGAIYLDNIKLDYLFVQDYTVRQKSNSTLNTDVNNYKGNNCKKFYGIIPDDRLAVVKKDIERIPINFTYDENISQYLLEDICFHNIGYDLSREPIGDFSGTPFSALQFILYTNPKRLYLVGWDCGAGYAYGGTNAMNPANYQIEILKKYFLPFINNYYSDLEIVSINPVGLKGIFKDEYTKE